MKRVLPIFFCCAAWSQTHTATVRGLVRDGSAAVVENAAVSLANVDQQRHWDARTGETGEYVLLQIPPGNYKLVVEAPGFKKYERHGLILQVAQTAELDVSLDLGGVTDSVQVTEETPLLEPASSFLGEVVNSRSAEALPLTTRNITQLVALTPGISDSTNFRAPAFSSGNSTRVAFSSSGGRGVTNEVMLDGSPQTVMQVNQPAYIPMPEAVQEFNVQTNSLPAEYGRSGGAVINIVHRSGTRDFHGVLYEFLRNDKLNATAFFDNRNGLKKASQRGHEFGFALGGPLTTSRKTTFFYLNWQRILVSAPATQTFTVPTERMRNGDFGEVAQVYDPTSIDAGGRRSPFAGNRIPSSRWNPIGVNLLKYYPNPTSPRLANNFVARSTELPSATDFSIKIDRRLSDRHNLFGRFSLEDWSDKHPNFFGNPASPDAVRAFGLNRSATLDDSYSRGGWIFHGNYGYAYCGGGSDPAAPGFDLTSLGFPASLKTGLQVANFPTIMLSGFPNLGPAAPSQVSKFTFETHAFIADATRVIGSHTVKLGGSYRIHRGSLFRPNWPAGLFQFSEGFTRETFNGNSGGNSVASLLLGLPFGLPTAGGAGYEPALALQSLYGAIYVQDDWRVNSRLTLNLGFRWDSDRPLTERFDRTSWFDFNATLPLAAPGIGPLRGGLVFAGRNGAPRGNKDSDNNNFAPRVGLAYRLTSKIVLRSGFGVMYSPTTGFGPTADTVGALSFNAFTDLVGTIDGGRTPFTTLSDPFPKGFNQPANGRDGLLTFIGQNVNAQVRGDRTPYVTQWHFNAQYELKNQMLFDLGYAGSSGVRLLAQAQLNQLPGQYLALGDGLNRVVANPLYGIVPATSALGQPTTTAGQLLRPYPQLNNLMYTWGSFSHSSYHSLQAKFRKRYRGGLQMLAAYTWSKMLDDNTGALTGGNQNPAFTDNNRRDLDKSYSSFDIPHRMVVHFEYELPFGAGRPFLSHHGVLNAVAGGWRVSGIAAAQSGVPISVTSVQNTTNSFGGNQRPNRTGLTSRTPGGVKDRIDNYLDRAAFSNPPRYTFGNNGRFLPENRGPGRQSWDVSFAKSFPIGELFRLDFRAETFNLLNRANFVGPATVFGQPQFGTIRQTENPRWIQLALKLNF